MDPLIGKLMHSRKLIDPPKIYCCALNFNISRSFSKLYAIKIVYSEEFANFGQTNSVVKELQSLECEAKFLHYWI